jgi:crossover junction endodeoxyribonuclease RusA
MIELELPWPPSVNNYKKVGATIKTAKGKIYQKRVNSPETKLFYYEVWIKIRSLKAIKRMETPLDSTIALKVSVCLHPPDKRRRDIDNPIKVLFDSLVRGGLIEDDSQIHLLVVEKKGIIPQGQVIVRIEEYLCTSTM